MFGRTFLCRSELVQEHSDPHDDARESPVAILIFQKLIT